MSNELTVISTLLWLLACWLTYRSGKAKGHRLGYELGLARGKEIARMIYEDARLAGRLEAWSEINDRVAALQKPTPDDRQVH